MIEVTVRHPAWRSALWDPIGVTTRAARAALAAHGLSYHLENAELSVVLADDDFVRALNCDYRGIDRPTNVLAFPCDAPENDRRSKSLGAPRLLGDVVVAFDTAQAEAAHEGKSLQDHVSHLVVHGVLHLAGYDHERATEAAVMQAAEARGLAELGIRNPYDPSTTQEATGAA